MGSMFFVAVGVVLEFVPNFSTFRKVRLVALGGMRGKRVFLDDRTRCVVCVKSAGT